MTTRMPIARYMTKSPLSIGADQSLGSAQRLMRKNRIRHLPVLRGGRLVGLLSLRDVHLVETFADVDPEEVSVDEAMSSDVYRVSPNTPVQKVAGEMARRKLGSAVVVEGNKVLGLFTTVDALRLLAEMGA